MSKILLNAISKFIDTRSLGSAFVVLAVLAMSFQSYAPKLLDDILFAVNEPFYFSLASDLRKQVEKMAKNPEDLKRADNEKYARFCSPGDVFIEKYVPGRPDARYLKTACVIVLDAGDAAVNS